MKHPGNRSFSDHLGFKDLYSVCAQKIVIPDQVLSPIDDLDRLNGAVVDATHAVDTDRLVHRALQGIDGIGRAFFHAGPATDAFVFVDIMFIGNEFAEPDGGQ